MKECNQCGKCCTKYGGEDLDVSEEEIALWELFNPDIYAYVKNQQIWFDPDTGVKLTQCPFLTLIEKKSANDKDKYICDIYLDRPDDCKHYPSLITEMIRDECEMIEPCDIEHQFKAQKKLDIIMIDSRHSKR
ncbi:YkgJ family cysteine cluster protein [Pseudoalteromonas sp. MMG010]|uniref:YkgJ family cysteine cluster protein n=1 Tax=Pseudoalteromonas sp. MMG010 TaxID=2822685 RepID=UPI001B3A6277|nr:YkgJ family cysteine cluster protein [Pseudoalteromonas sp. MMG010]MBQ4832362.1 YkgJ family cysteine cluster protein [Pseudoalteromonas sp. MMG010]